MSADPREPSLRPRSALPRHARRGRTASLALTLMLSGAAAGCGAAPPHNAAFGGAWTNDQGASITALYDRLKAESVLPATPVVVGVTERGLVGLPLRTGTKWEFETPVDTQPTIVGNLVIGSGGGRVYAVDSSRGTLLWSLPTEGRSLRGAGDDGDLTLVSLGAPNGGQSRLVAVNRSGDIVQSIDSREELGTPAVFDGIGFVPWGSQYVSAIDLRGGRELGRLLMRDQVTSALTLGDHLYFGEGSLLRFDAATAQASTGGGAKLARPVRPLPGNPQWLRPGNDVKARAAGAAEKVRLYGRPLSSGSSVTLDSETLAATYFPTALGLNAQNGALRWARLLDADILGGSGAEDGFVLCDASGTIHGLASTTGTEVQTEHLGQPVTACVVEANDFRVTGPGKPQLLPEQIGVIVRSSNTGLAPVQQLLLRELGSIQEELVTRVLIEIVTDSRTPRPLAEEAADLLALRRNGADYMIAALAQPYDFLDDVLRAPPVGPLADALSAMHDPRGAKLLAQHLNDPANSPGDVERAAKALETLATPAELQELRTFFILYKATVVDDEMINAVLSTARILAKQGSAHERSMIDQAARDPLTHPRIRTEIQHLLTSRATNPEAVLTGL